MHPPSPPGGTPALEGAHLGQGPPSVGLACRPHLERAPRGTHGWCGRRGAGEAGARGDGAALARSLPRDQADLGAQGRVGGGSGTFWTDP